MQTAYVMLLESPCCKTPGTGVWPWVSQAQMCSQGNGAEAARAVPGVV